jgi:[acyl-carrier-protein] S-malonyltransferase
MGGDVCAAVPEARAVFEAADEALGMPLSRLCFEGPAEALLPTEIQQPAILTTSIALLRALEARGASAPGFVAGHSLGEYSALVASGALEFEAAVRLVHHRGRYMQEAVPEGEGAMAAVLGLAVEGVEAACAAASEQTGQVVSPANYNSPIQTVIAGTRAAVEAACSAAREAGARRTVPLPVSAPFHCALMAPAAEKLAPELEAAGFGAPSPPVVTNVEARPNEDAARIPDLLCRQVTAPVRFTEGVQCLAAMGVTRVLEVGPGKVLSGLVGRIESGLTRANLGVLDDLEGAVALSAAPIS